MPILKTDLNARERKSYAEKLRQVSESSSRLADALETGNDGEAVMHILMLAISGDTINSIMAIFKDALKTDFEKSADKEEFERIANEINEK